jgi:hypothetical protein
LFGVVLCTPDNLNRQTDKVNVYGFLVRKSDTGDDDDGEDEEDELF